MTSKAAAHPERSLRFMIHNAPEPTVFCSAPWAYSLVKPQISSLYCRLIFNLQSIGIRCRSLIWEDWQILRTDKRVSIRFLPSIRSSHDPIEMRDDHSPATMPAVTAFASDIARTAPIGSRLYKARRASQQARIRSNTGGEIDGDRCVRRVRFRLSASACRLNARRAGARPRPCRGAARSPSRRRDGSGGPCCRSRP